MFRNRIRTYFERRDCRVALTVVSPSKGAGSVANNFSSRTPARRRQCAAESPVSAARRAVSAARRRVAELLHLILWHCRPTGGELRDALPAHAWTKTL